MQESVRVNIVSLIYTLNQPYNLAISLPFYHYGYQLNIVYIYMFVAVRLSQILTLHNRILVTVNKRSK